MTNHTDTPRRDDLVEWLRDWLTVCSDGEVVVEPICEEIADHIEALQAEIKKRGDMILHMGANTAEMANQYRDRIEALEAENMMLREERDRLIKFVNIMCEEYGLEYDGVVKQ